MFGRRSFLYLSISALGAVVAIKPRDNGENHSPEFQQLSTALDEANCYKPTLIVDYDHFVENIKTLKNNINDRYKIRIVGKSLPSVPLLKLAMDGCETDRVMLFHQTFLKQIAKEIPGADVLMGKPLPVSGAQDFYETLSPDAHFKPAEQLQWLVDTPERLHEYQQLAGQINEKIRINIEIDVGLHRGGVQDPVVLKRMLKVIKEHPLLHFSGFMGYEPHIIKVSGDTLDNRDASMRLYEGYVNVVREVYGVLPEGLTLNCAGSQTYQLYDSEGFPFNELAAGSCLVKPTDFDLPTLKDHKVASYIAAPVLKVDAQTQIPGVDIGKLISYWNPNRKQVFRTYGGYWKAVPESPKGLLYSPILGRSTNQETMNGSSSIDLRPNDWVFLRPTQSEFVFLQFEGIALYKDGRIVETWPIFGEA
ncbi:MAG: DSD1 family PLP-dependent enzyme [Halioglobus sp.]